MKRHFVVKFKKLTALLLTAALIIGNASLTMAAADTELSEELEAAENNEGLDTVVNAVVSENEDIVSKKAETGEFETEVFETDAIAEDDLEVPSAGAFLERSTSKASDLESIYSSKEYFAKLRDQGSSSLCWAFCVTSLLEANAVKKGITNVDIDQLSPDAMGYYFYNHVTDSFGNTEGTSVSRLKGSNYLNASGNPFNTVFEMAQWITPVSEEEFPFDGTAHTYPKTVESAYGRDIFHMNGARWVPVSDKAAIKQLVKEYGGVSLTVKGYSEFVTTSYDGMAVDPVTTGSGNKVKTLFYNGSDTNAGHAVTIIGWDDTISSSCFKGYSSSGTFNGAKPEKNGAWIIRNSYADNGYYYMSYEDSMFTAEKAKAVAFSVDTAQDYDNNYGYDGGIGTHTVGTKDNTLYGAEIFKVNAKGGEHQSVEGAEFFTNTVGTDYEVRIYRNPTASNPASGTLVASQKGSTSLPGCYSVSFDEKPVFAAGDTFSIVVILKKAKDASEVAPNTGLTFMYDDLYGGSSGDWVRSSVEAKAGRSFLSKDGSSWSDTSVAQTDFKDVNSTREPKAGYVRIKAFTNETEVLEDKYIDSDMVADIPAQMYTGRQITPEPVVYYRNKRLVPEIDFTVTYGRNINTGKASGTMTIKGAGDYKTKTGIIKTFTITKRSLESAGIEVFGTDNVEYSGGDMTPISLSCDGLPLKEGRDYTIKYKKNNGIGTSNVVIKGRGNFVGVRKLSFGITSKSISGDAITIKDIPAQSYTGEFITPEPVVRNESVKGLILEKDKDYKLEYVNNLMPGIATCIVTGIGNYTGVRTVNFLIKNVNIKDVAMAALSNQNYTGMLITPDIKLTYKGKELVESVDYTVTFSNNLEVGTATVEITGNPGTIYAGSSRKESFKILPINMSGVTFENFGDVSYSLGKSLYTQNTNEDSEKCMRLRLPSGIYLNPSEYSITYTSNKSNGEALVKANMTVASNSKNLIGRVTKSFNIISGEKILLNDYTDKNLVISGFAANREYIYDTSDLRKNVDKTVKPAISLYYKGERLIEGTDYSVKYENNRQIGTANIIITAISNSRFSGTINEKYYIIGKPIYSRLDVADNDFSVKGPSDCTYDGGQKKPGIIIYETLKTDKKKGNSSRVLEEGTDYVLKYSANVNVGEASVTLTGIGNYSGSHTFTFEILPSELDKVKKSSVGSQQYTGEQIRPEQYLKNVSRFLVEGVDYDVQYGENTYAGTGTITYVAREDQKNYVGELMVSFPINARDLSDARVYSNSIPDEEYTGDAHAPAVSLYLLTNEGSIEIPESEYNVIYGKNVKVGKGTIKVVARSVDEGGSGNFKGSRTIKFNILPKQMDIVAGEEISVVYTGKKVTPKPPVITLATGEELIYGVDFTTKSDKRKDAGKGTLTIVGKGVYKGIYAYTTYTIEPIEVTDDMVFIKEIKPLNYVSPKAYLKPDLKIKAAGKNLKKNRDYVVTYINNNQRGSASALITFVGNYSGSYEQEFVIQ